MSDSRRTITISGPPGSGTTTLAQVLVEHLGLRYVNTGQLFRDLAGEYGMTLQEFGRYASDHREVDDELDRRQLDLARQGGIVLEGRLAGHYTHRFQVDALRVFLSAAPEVRAARIGQRDGHTTAEAASQMTERAVLERARYLEHYHIDIEDTGVYDLVLDSASASPEQLAQEVLRVYR